MTMQDEMLTTAQAAVRLGVHRDTLRTWRSRGLGPPFFKLGKVQSSHVRYSMLALEEWKHANKV